MGEYIQALGGTRYAGWACAAFLSYLLLSTSPFWWPAVRAHRSRMRLPHPKLFTVVVATLTYGGFYLTLMPCMLLLDGLNNLPYSDPQRVTPLIAHLAKASGYIQGWLFIWMPPVLLLIAFLLTRRLAPRWMAVCEVVDAG